MCDKCQIDDLCYQQIEPHFRRKRDCWGPGPSAELLEEDENKVGSGRTGSEERRPGNKSFAWETAKIKAKHNFFQAE